MLIDTLTSTDVDTERYSPLTTSIFGDRAEISPVFLSEDDFKRMRKAKHQRVRLPLRRQPENNTPSKIRPNNIAYPRLMHHENVDFPEENGFYAVFSLAGIDILPPSKLRLDPEKAIGVPEKWGLLAFWHLPEEQQKHCKEHIVTAMKKRGALVYLRDIFSEDGDLLPRHQENEAKYSAIRQIVINTEWYSPYFMPPHAIRRFMKVGTPLVRKIKKTKKKDLLDEGYAGIDDFRKQWDSRYGPKYKTAGRYQYDHNPWIETADVIELKIDKRKGIDLEKITGENL